MASPEQMVATQLANILALTGKTVENHAKEIVKTEFSKHMEIVKFLKEKYELGHGNANLLAANIRELLAGNPPSADELSASQYAGGKSVLMPIMELLCSHCESMGDDVTRVVQKTGVAFRRNKLFALVQTPSAKRMHLSLNLEQTPDDNRAKAHKSMCSHRIDLISMAEIDDAVVEWIRQSYDRC